MFCTTCSDIEFNFSCFLWYNYGLIISRNCGQGDRSLPGECVQRVAEEYDSNLILLARMWSTRKYSQQILFNAMESARPKVPVLHLHNLHAPSSGGCCESLPYVILIQWLGSGFGSGPLAVEMIWGNENCHSKYTHVGWSALNKHGRLSKP